MRFVAKYFGFLAFKTGRGMSLLVCGLVLFTYARAFLAVLEEANHAPTGASLVMIISGACVACVGLLNLLLVLACCGSPLAPDELTEHFRQTHAAARQQKLKAGLASALAADLEKGEGAKAAAKAEAAANKKAGKKSSTRGSKAAPPPEVAQTSAAAADPKLDNPFFKRPSVPDSEEGFEEINVVAAPANENPFLKQRVCSPQPARYSDRV